MSDLAKKCHKTISFKRTNSNATSTLALTNATLPYALRLANLGVKKAVETDPGLRDGVNTFAGHITCEPVAESQDRPFRDLSGLL